MGLNSVSYPYPSGSWSNYISYVYSSSDLNRGDLLYKFGASTLAHYWLDVQSAYYQTPDLWKTRHYPFHAVKEGGSLLCEFLEALGFSDTLGLVTYDIDSRIESGLHDAYTPVEVTLDPPLTYDYPAINTIQTHKQAAHYSFRTNIGGGIKSAKELLDTYGRSGAKKVLLVMTDGNANERPYGWSLPGDWDWADLTDFDGDGSPDYTTSDSNKLYAFAMARECIQAGYTIHTMSVGANADRDLMEAIAFAGNGVWLNVPGGSTVSEMEGQALDAFREVASDVPEAKLIVTE